LPEAAACAEEITRHRTDLAISLVKEASRADAFLYVTGLILADIDYLRLSGQLGRVRDAMHKRVAALRVERLNAERYSAEAEIDRLTDEEFAAIINHYLNLETHLLFGAGLLAHFDKSHGDAKVILDEVLFAGRSSSEWHEHPRNLRYHFRDLRNYWLTVFLLHAAHPDIHGGSRSQSLRLALATHLRKRLNELLERFNEESPDETQDRILLRNRIGEMMNLLLVDLGAHTLREWHHRIRYLQTHVLRDRERHSPLWTALKAVELDFRDLIAKPGDTALKKRLPRHIREALNAAITLREVAEVARRLALYPSHAIADQLQPLFAEPTKPHSFHRTVMHLVELQRRSARLVRTGGHPLKIGRSWIGE
jgi:hypothetical protein